MVFESDAAVTATNGNAEQVRVIAETVADTAITRFVAQNPPRADMPPPLKWAGGIAAVVLGGIFLAGCVWLFSSVSAVQVTLARMDERLEANAASQEARLAELERRVTAIEAEQEDP